MKKNIVAITLLAAIVTVPVVALADGAATFKAKCAACHGADAGKKLDGVKAASEADIAKTIENGKDAKPMKMPAYSGKLTAAEITEVAKYLKSIKK